MAASASLLDINPSGAERQQLSVAIPPSTRLRRNLRLSVSVNGSVRGFQRASFLVTGCEHEAERVVASNGRSSI